MATGSADGRAHHDGFVNFDVDVSPYNCKLWYRIYGQWPRTTITTPPTLVLHGGPGFTHDYLLCMSSLARSPYGGTVIFFDQLGSGKSTHLPHTLNDSKFWTEQLFLDQVEAVLSQLEISNSYYLFGQSWGAMLAASWASKRPPGLKRLVLASGPASSEAWLNAYARYRNDMPSAERIILEQERTQETWTEPAYLEAIEHFYRRHFMNLPTVPVDLQKSYDAISDDPTVTLSCLGPDEFVWTGFCKSWKLSASDIGKINVPTLVTNGCDEGCDEESIRMWQSNIPDCTYVNFPRSTHMAHLEEPESFLKTVGDFLYPMDKDR